MVQFSLFFIKLEVEAALKHLFSGTRSELNGIINTSPTACIIFPTGDLMEDNEVENSSEVPAIASSRNLKAVTLLAIESYAAFPLLKTIELPSWMVEGYIRDLIETKHWHCAVK